jgi:2'-5' RNA ligase
MSVIRAFIAIELSAEIRSKLDQVIGHLRNDLDSSTIRWVPAENIHLTLKFLGDVSITNLEILKKILQGEVARFSTFEISVGDLGAFPSIKRPRVIWVKVQAPADLNQLQRSIEDGTTRLGYAREERSFSPHLTLGRVSRNADSRQAGRVGDTLALTQVGFLGAMRVREVHLFRSDLRPSGAVYSRLFSAGLKPNSGPLHT